MSGLRGAALLMLATLVGGVVFGLVYGAGDGLLMGALLLVSGIPVVGGAHLLVRRRSSVGALSRQFSAVIGLAIGLVTLGVGAIALLMFVSPHDAVTMVVLFAFAGVLTAYVASLLASEVLEDIETVRDGVRAVGEGKRDGYIRTAAADELADLAAAANRMTEQLARNELERDAAEGARRELIAAVSHDLRTPLTSLRLLAEAVEEDLVDAETRQRYVEQMSVHIRSLSALIEDLFELSRLEAGEIQWSMRQVALDELVEETVEAMRPQADAKRVAVQAAVSDGIAPAQANPEKLQRVLFNLIQNAIRHTPEDGSVTVVAESNETSVEVEVADTGEGVEPADRERVFQPFFRGGPGAARSGEGTGLGLTICRAIVEAHGGKIWLADSSIGARVRFSLPRAA